jgi:hypothetical protein
MVVLLGMRYVGLASSVSLLRVSSGPGGNNDALFAQIGVDQVAGFVGSLQRNYIWPVLFE